MLRQKTRVPPRLPTYFGTESGLAIVAGVEVATPTQYAVALDLAPDCGGANACRLGKVTGEVMAAGAKPMRGTVVKLKHGITGYFVDATCDRICTDSKLSWQEGRYRYTVGIKAEQLEELTRVANSAIPARLPVKKR